MSEYECYCEPMVADGYCEAWISTTRRASRPYKCCECGEPIIAGHLYEYLFTAYEGNVSTHRTCIFCAVEFERLMNLMPEGLVKGDLACAVIYESRGYLDRAIDYGAENIKWRK